MTVVSSYNLTSGHLWNGCFAEMRLMIQEEKHNIYLEKGKSTNTHQIWTLPKDSSENLQQVKFVWGHHPKWPTQTGTSLIWWTEWATLIDSLTALWISSGYPVCEWGLHLWYPESTRFFGGQKMKNWSYNFRMSALCFLLLILACSCGEKSIGLILQEK